MPEIQFRPSGVTVNVDAKTTISEAALRAGVSVTLPCGGKGTCGRCLVAVIEGDPVVHVHPPEEARDGEVLSCQTEVGPSGCVIELPERDLSAEDRFVEPEISDVPYSGFDPADIPLKRINLKVPEPAPDDGLSDIDRTGRELRRQLSVKDIRWGVSVMQKLPEALRGGSDNFQIDVFYFENDSVSEVVEVRPSGDNSVAGALAVDLGTTTISVKIFDTLSGKELAGATGYNEQIFCGEDVISRINYALRPERLKELRDKALASINRLADLAAREAGFSSGDILCAVISGNTVMMHLLLGIIPEYLRLEPYTPAVLDIPEMRASEAGIEINPSGMIYFSPSVGSYVGGDITAGILCTDMNATDEIELFIDVGTNGEIVMGNNEFLMTCACSAGPAFEGGGIGCGMRAMEGAVNSVSVRGDRGAASVNVIGGGKARGICGSGMIDLIAELFLNGILDPSGRFVRDGGFPAVEIDGRRARYRLVEGDDSFSGEPLYISEQDIENIMRAKAAVFSACTLMLSQAGIGFDDISKVYVAGGFGRGISVENAVTIGLLPDIPAERFSYIGNASLEGSVGLCLSEKDRDLQRSTAGRMTYINLSNEADYSEQYSAALFLPHTDMSLFPGVAKRRG